ncbi:alcohol dehydrogenase [Chitiniphilus shinanonensis]|uniref:Alcohol dehydrogenase n=1 Tax=Chitiniphilus shinanonensis TaxID=553088 RepID=A0ABQ6BU73_9NEIS|nr:MDR family oxidoreductase [Chitiniphilus shinanonensis]GLS05007.1 alcohol dehydrogenase [Chitiniphilus shinanonensis]
MFRTILLRREDGCFDARVTELDEVALPEGDVLLGVHYSTLNYKDALAIADRGPVVRAWPMVPGVDGAGEVLESNHPEFRPGDLVVLNGWGVGELHWGCLAQKARLKGDWLVKLPQGFTTRQAMAVGTAGYTAMLCVQALEQHGVTPVDGPVLVTGATGGVGSVAVMLLAGLGYEVVALTGKADAGAYLQILGAREVLERAEFGVPGKPLQKERWAAVIDTAGSHTLANACAQVRYGGAVAACGLAQGMDFPATVAPFILRGVTLYGIDSVYAPLARRRQAWQRLGRDLDVAGLEQIVTEIGLAQALAAAQDIMAGRHRGRFVVDVNR